MMTYKGYPALVEYDDEAELFHGEVIGIRDLVTFQGRTVDQLKAAFHDSVDDYLEFCAERGEEPNKPLSGRFLVRIDPGLHRRTYLAAKAQKKSINAWVAEAIERAAEEALAPKRSTRPR